MSIQFANRVFIWINILSSATSGALGSSYFHLGCFSDDPSSPDLTGPRQSLGLNLTGDQCIGGCQTTGYPYSALNKVNAGCFCGTSFGKYGPANDCNQDCDGFSCGGEENNNDVYYTVDVSASADVLRSLSYVPLSRSFEEARMDCVSQNGDLPSINNLADLNNTLGSVRSTGIRLVKVWIGMRLNTTTSTYEWVDPTSPKYGSPNSNLFLWKPNAAQSACVLLNIDSEQMETAPCTVPYTYVCRAQPQSTDGKYIPMDPSGHGRPRLALLIVLPLFLLCYGGSCIVYCAHKVYRNCRRKPHRGKLNFTSGKNPMGNLLKTVPTESNIRSDGVAGDKMASKIAPEAAALYPTLRPLSLDGQPQGKLDPKFSGFFDESGAVGGQELASTKEQLEGGMEKMAMAGGKVEATAME